MRLLQYLRKCGQFELEQHLGFLLRIGVLVSALTVVIGWAGYLARHGIAAPQYTVFKGEPAELCRISGIVQEAGQIEPEAIVQLGLLLLLATPIARVAFSVFAFACQKDWIYVLFTLVVLSILAYSIVFGVG